jgi:Predicted metal-binding integral membrane protein (DUF2182)
LETTVGRPVLTANQTVHAVRAGPIDADTSKEDSVKLREVVQASKERASRLRRSTLRSYDVFAPAPDRRDAASRPAAIESHFRRRCRESVRSGLEFGLYCVGSSIGLMAMLLALGVMSVTWMSVIAILVLAQKLLPPRAAIDLPLALAIVALGVLIVIAPSSVPGLTPAMSM